MNTLNYIIFFSIFLAFVLFFEKSTIEGYESLTNCIDQGYPKDWCMKTPIQSQIDDGYCYCGNGQLGTFQYDGKCYFQKDLEVLEDFIYLNISLEGRKPLEIGVQKWKNMRLDFLYLGVNNLTVIPESICEIYANLSAINISRNKICPPYPACITAIVKEQDTSSCP